MLTCPLSSALPVLIGNESFLSFLPVPSESYVASSIHALDVPTYTFHNFQKLCAMLKTLRISKIDPDIVAVAFFMLFKNFLHCAPLGFCFSCWYGFFT